MLCTSALRSVNAQLEQSLATSVSELSQARADASMQDGLARQLEDKLAPRLHVILASLYRY